MNDILVPSFPYVVGWSITNKCNLACKHCNMSSGKEWENELTYIECCNVINELAENNVKEILFTGGEPFTRDDFIKICDYAISKGIEVGVTTNSLLLDKKIIEQELWKFSDIRVSIDSIIPNEHDDFRNKKGVFAHAIDSIKLMKKNGYFVSVSTCLSKRNFMMLEDMAKYFSKIGINHWCLPLLSPDGRGKNLSSDVLSGEDIIQVIKGIKGISEKYPKIKIGVDLPYIAAMKNSGNNINKVANCVAGITELTIFANGDISPCFAMITSAGNIRSNTLKDIWNNSDMFIKFRDKTLIKGKCKECEYLYSCGGGCRANAYIKTGDFLDEDWLCWI